MPIHGKKHTTSHSADSTQGQFAPALPDQDEFRQHLRELARGAIRVVLEDVMRSDTSDTTAENWARPVRHRSSRTSLFGQI